jgi:hypothetical protein
MHTNRPAWQVIPALVVMLVFEWLRAFAGGCLPIIVVAIVTYFLGIAWIMQSQIALAGCAALLVLQGALWVSGRD